MQVPPAGKGVYKGFRATGSLMSRLAKVDPSVSAAVPTQADGFL